MIGSTNHSASFTRLSFHPHGQGPERVGRRLTAVSDGWRLSGNLKTLGYFAANVCLGADHKTFSLIVDILLLIGPSCVLDMDVLGQAWSAHGWHLHEVTCQRRANASVVLMVHAASGLAVLASHIYIAVE